MDVCVLRHQDTYLDIQVGRVLIIIFNNLIMLTVIDAELMLHYFTLFIVMHV